MNAECLFQELPTVVQIMASLNSVQIFPVCSRLSNFGIDDRNNFSFFIKGENVKENVIHGFLV